MQPDYRFLRRVSWLSIYVFVALQALWIVRCVRKGDLDIPFLLPFAKLEISVLLEHFAAGWGLPALASAAIALALSSPAHLAKNPSWFKQSLVITYVGLGAAILYLGGEFGHETEQMLLWKEKTNYWWHAKHCLAQANAEIVTFAKCTAGYLDAELNQLLADVSGVLLFLALTWFSLSRVFGRCASNG
ncbi:MAG: hypothetical protein FDZ72_16585 [Betaproteobacteria bacterium]|nr:MAG: hypothetical protein FDZ72_16585 [Betaproteobacteria bacterium]